MSVEKILSDWKKKSFKPVYWLEGEEDYYIDRAIDYAEHELLPENERAFNLSIFYGKDANWADVINTCRKYPMFADRQVVLLKEAQQMRDVEKLEAYIENPLQSTIFIISYKEKKLDARKKFAKLLKERGELITTRKIYEKDLPEWIREHVQSKGKAINPKAINLLAEHTGNDLARIDNEINKLLVNMGNRATINEDDIEKYIGVSKEYNVFELQTALASKNLSKAMKIIQFFEANPKAGPIQLVLPSLYSFFSKVFMVYGSGTADEKTIAVKIGVNPFFARDYITASKLYSYPEVEKVLLLLHQYNLKSIGIGSVNQEDASLLKEMLAKILLK